MSHIQQWPRDKRGPSGRPWNQEERHAGRDGDFRRDPDGLAGLQRRQRGLKGGRTFTSPAGSRKHRKR